MATDFATGFGMGETGEEAGRNAANRALSGMSVDAPDFGVVFSSPKYDCADVIPGIRSITGDCDLIGSTAQGIFTGDGIHTSFARGGNGVTVALVASDDIRFFTGIGRELSNDLEAGVSEAAEGLPSSVDGYPNLTGLLFSSSPIRREEIGMLTYQQVPIQWAGGGASDVSQENVAVFTGDEIASDGVALAVFASKYPAGVGVGHAHEPIGGSYTVTKSDENFVYELDGEPAYEVWKRAFDELVAEQFGYHIEDVEDDQPRLMQVMAEMAFGIRTGDDEYKIRTPLKTVYLDESDAAAGALYLGGSIPEGVVLHRMGSSETRTIERGKEAVRQATADMDRGPVAGALAFDCACGELVLGREYNRLTEAISDSIGAPLAGFQSAGQACFNRTDMRGQHSVATSLFLFPNGEPE